MCYHYLWLLLSGAVGSKKHSMFSKLVMSAFLPLTVNAFRARVVCVIGCS